MNDHWSHWMKAAQQGDKDAYASLLREVQAWLQKYYRNRTHANVVEDLVQETLMTIHNKRHTYDPAYPFGPWLAAIARHRFIDWLRQQGRRAEVALNDEMDLAGPSDNQAAVRHDLDRYMNSVSQDQQTAIRLVKLEQLSYEEAAQRTGQSVSAMKVLVHRGLKKMTELALREARQS